MTSQGSARRKRGPPPVARLVGGANAGQPRRPQKAASRLPPGYLQHLKAVELATQHIATGRFKPTEMVSALLSVQWLILYGGARDESHRLVGNNEDRLTDNNTFMEKGWAIVHAGLRQGEYRLGEKEWSKARGNLADWRAQLVEPWLWLALMGSGDEASPATLNALCLAVLSQLEIARAG